MIDTNSVFLMYPDHENFVKGQSRQLSDDLVARSRRTPVWCKLVNAIVMACSSLLFLYVVLIYDPWMTRLWTEQGVSTEATVTECRIEKNSLNSRTSAIFSYVYTVGDEGYGHRERLSNTEWYEQLSEGDKISIQYLRDEPGKSVVDESIDTIDPNAFKLLLLGLGVGLLIGTINTVRNAIAVEKSLQALEADAILLSGELIEMKGKLGQPVEVHFRFETPKHFQLTDKRTVRKIIAPPHLRPFPGTPLAILYLSENCYELL
jgi:hypothetical protein